MLKIIIIIITGYTPNNLITHITILITDDGKLYNFKT
jgi:hypothetical protein